MKNALTLISFFLLFGVNVASAQEIKEKEKATMPLFTTNKIVVTTTRTLGTVYETPASVVTYGLEELTIAQPSTIQDVLLNLPNVSFTDPSNPLSQKASIRGSSPDSIIYLIDGARQDYTSESGLAPTGFFIDPDMLKSVEVKRGPASVLYGSGGIGGVIALETKDAADFLKPGENIGARIKTGFRTGNQEWYNSGSVYGRSGIWDIIALYTRRNTGGYLSTKPKYDAPYIGRDRSEAQGDYNSFMTKVSAIPTDDSYLSLSYNYDDGHSEGKSSKYASDQNRLLGKYEVEYGDFVDIRFVLQHAWRNFSYENYMVDLDDDFSSTGGSLQNTSIFSFGDAIQNELTYGVDAYWANQSGTTSGVKDPARPDSSADDIGLFVQNIFSFYDTVDIIPALRFTQYSRSSNDNVASDQDASKVTPSITLQVRPFKWLSIFGTFAESYRPPSLDEIYYTMHMDMGPMSYDILPNPNLKAEEATTWEFGFNLNLQSLLADKDSLGFKFTYFNEDIKNLISAKELSSFPNMALQMSNESSVSRYGYEAQADYTVSNFTINLAYGRTIGHNDDTNELTGGMPAMFSLRTSYNFEKWGVTPYWSARFVGSYETTDAWGDRVDYDSYNVHAIGLTWAPAIEALSDFRLDLALNNIFDTRYENYYGGYEMGQSLSATVSYSF